MTQTIVFIGIIVAMIIAIVFYKSWKNKGMENKSAWDVLDFIEKNPHRTSLYATKNSVVLATSSPLQPMPLARTVPLVIAIEYANQVAKGYIDKNQLVSFSDLALYDIPNADNGAHQSWKATFENQYLNTIHQDKVRLYDVVKGMIHNHSNANTAFLLDVLDVNQINRTLQQLHLDTHEDIYYFTASFLLPAYLYAEESLSKRNVKCRLKEMTLKDFRAYSGIIHGLLTYRQAHDLMDPKIQEKIIDTEVQKLIADRLPSASIEAYSTLMSEIFHGEKYTGERRLILEELLEKQPLKQENQWAYFGAIGGSTLSTTNHVVYGITEHKQHRFVLGICMNNLTRNEGTWIREEIDTFINRCLTDQEFQAELNKRLG